MDEQQRFNIKQVADVLNMSPDTIRHLAKDGAISYEKHGKNTFRFTQQSVNDYVTRNRGIFKKPMSAYEMKKAAMPATALGKMPKASDVYAYTVDDVANLAGISPWSIRTAERNGTLQSKRNGKRVLFDRDYIDGLLDNHFFDNLHSHKPNTASVPTGKMSLGEASDYIGISYFTLRQMAHEGTIKNTELPSGKRVFDKSDLDDYITDNGAILVPGVHWHDCKKIKDAATELGITIKELDRLCDDNRIGYVRSFFGKRMLRPIDIEVYRTGTAPDGYTTQHSCEGGMLPSCIGDGAEKPLTPEQEAAKKERDEKRAEKRAALHAVRYQEFEQQKQSIKQDREQAKKEYLESLVVSGVTSIGNVVRFDLALSPVSFGDSAVSDDALETAILGDVACQLTLAFPLDVECIVQDTYAAANRSLFENGDAPAMVVLDGESMATASDARTNMCAASKHATRYYINDYFKIPANAVEMSCDVFKRRDDGVEPAETPVADTQTAGATFELSGDSSAPVIVE